MLQEVNAYNGFELLCSELNMGQAEFTACIQNEPEKIIEQINTLEIAAFPMQLERDVRLKGNETPFITRGTDLRPHFTKLIQQIARGSEFEAPPMIAPSAEINDFLRKKIGHSFNQIIGKVAATIQIGKVNEIYKMDRDLKAIADQFSELISQYLSTPAMITGFLRFFTDGAASGQIEQNTRIAFVAMAALSSHEEFSQQADDVRRWQLIEMGLAMLFQDIACLLDNIRHDDNEQTHAPRSAQIAEKIGLPAPCIETIRHHHRTMDDDGFPILSTQKPSLLQNMAVITNSFIYCLTNEALRLDLDQVIYVISHYAELQYFAQDCLRALGKVCIGERKQRIISKAYQIMRQCPSGGQALLWDVSTSLPNRFICRNKHCEHITDEEVTVYHSIRYDGPTRPIEIPKGHYHKCGHLTYLFNQWLLQLMMDGTQH